jgi:hypothetical protein
MFAKALRFLLGFTAGTLLWWYGTPPYNGLLARAAEPLVRLDSRLEHAMLRGAGRIVMITGAPEARIPADQLTYNVILFLALFATIRGGIRDRRFAIFMLSVLVLLLTHVLALVATIMATYVRILPDRFSPLESDVWIAAEYAYRLAGMFGISFACWWVARESGRPTRSPRA